MKDDSREAKGPRVCPHCGRSFSAPPALSRVDNQTMVCPECGTREALASIGVPPDEIEKILETVRLYSSEK